MNVLRRKSWHDIVRRRARSVFTVITIAIAVAGLSLFAMPPLMDRAMADQIAKDKLHDIRFLTADIVLDSSDRSSIEQIAGVNALEVRTLFPTRVFFGDRREDAWLVGVESFDDQLVNVVSVDDGAPPPPPKWSPTGRTAGVAGSPTVWAPRYSLRTPPERFYRSRCPDAATHSASARSQQNRWCCTRHRLWSTSWRTLVASTPSSSPSTTPPGPGRSPMLFGKSCWSCTLRSCSPSFPTSGQLGHIPVRRYSTTSAPFSTWGRCWR